MINETEVKIVRFFESAFRVAVAVSIAAAMGTYAIQMVTLAMIGG